MISGIYKIYFIDTPNKVYIGSSKNVETRKKQHLKGLRKNNHINSFLQYAFNKYGESNLVFEVIEEIDSTKLIEREKFHYCEALDNNLVVYNVIIPDKTPTNTGRTRFKKGLPPWNKGRKNIYSNKTKEMMAKAKIGKNLGNQNGFKKGMKTWNRGLKMSEEHCKKLSGSHKGQIPWFKKRGVKPPLNTGRTRFKKL